MQEDFNQVVSIAVIGTSYSDVYEIDPSNAELFMEVVVSALSGTGTPVLDVTIEISRNKVTWTDFASLDQFTTTATENTRDVRPLRYARFKLVTGGSTIAVDAELFMQASAGTGASGTDLPVSIYQSSALEASGVVKAIPGSLEGLTGRIDSTLDGGTYYLQIIDSATVPGDGAVTVLMAPLKIIHVGGTDSEFDIDLKGRSIKGTAGLAFALSTSDFGTKTIAGSGLSLTAFYR
jgi:hypothetical protein